jgi:hypothetical protein
MQCFMFDTVAFNRVLDGAILLDQLRSEVRIYATHIQEDELNNTVEPSRRSDLKRIFHEFLGQKLSTESLVLDVSKLDESRLNSDNKVPTETSVWGIGRWGEGKWNTDGGLYELIRVKLDERKKKQNNIQDALIAETAIINKFCLVTDDGNLYSVTKSIGGDVLSFSEFLEGQ